MSAEEELCRRIAARTGTPVEKVRRVRALARGRTFSDEQAYMDSWEFGPFEAEEFGLNGGYS